ncbi:putative beta-glucosidase K [Fusarium oxysporum f. sp. albedinis]|nr:putative beta-glucosidase K [Fusarium oxysporum f. sp. albedinis]
MFQISSKIHPMRSGFGVLLINCNLCISILRHVLNTPPFPYNASFMDRKPSTAELSLFLAIAFQSTSRPCTAGLSIKESSVASSHQSNPEPGKISSATFPPSQPPARVASPQHSSRPLHVNDVREEKKPIVVIDIDLDSDRDMDDAYTPRMANRPP